MTESPPNPAYDVRSERLQLRCYEPADTEPMLAVLAESREHLSPWLSWATHEPLPLDEKLTWIRGALARFDRGEDFVYGLFEGQTGELIGGSGLHSRCGPGGLEIGYWIAPPAGRAAGWPRRRQRP